MAMLRADYYRLQDELRALERKHPDPASASGFIYLADEGVDRENVPVGDVDPDFWSLMYSAACMAAGQRGEEYGLDINKLLGRSIY